MRSPIGTSSQLTEDSTSALSDSQVLEWCTLCLVDRAGWVRPMGETHFWKTHRGTVRSITNIYSLVDTNWPFIFSPKANCTCKLDLLHLSNTKQVEVTRKQSVRKNLNAKNCLPQNTQFSTPLTACRLKRPKHFFNLWSSTRVLVVIQQTN